MIVVEAEDEDAAIYAALDRTPSLCAACSGWGRDVGLDLGDWEPAPEEPVELITDEE